MLTIDWTAFWVACAFLVGFWLFRRWGSRFPAPHLRFSNLEALQRRTGGWRTTLHNLPRLLEYTALALFLLAFVDPHMLIPKASEEELPSPEPTQGIGIYLVLDQSGSMKQNAELTLPDGSRKLLSKIGLLKEVTTQFIHDRPHDMIGVVAFSRGAQVLSPMTLDHQTILKLLKKFDIMRLKDQDGTSIGYAIYKTANTIAATRHYAQDLQGAGQPAYEIKSSIIVLVTDGLQDPSDLDKGKRLRNLEIPEAAEIARQLGVRLYLVNVEPRLAAKEFEPNLRQMRESAELTGGKFFLMDGSTSLSDIYAEINRLEKSQLPGQDELSLLRANIPKEKLPRFYQLVSFYPHLIGLGLFLLGIAWILKTTLLRQIP